MFLFRFATSSRPNEAFDCVKWTFVKVAFLKRAHHWVWLMFCFCKRNTGVEFLKVFSVRCQRGRGQGDRGLEGGGGWVGYYWGRLNYGLSRVGAVTRSVRHMERTSESDIWDKEWTVIGETIEDD